MKIIPIIIPTWEIELSTGSKVQFRYCRNGEKMGEVVQVKLNDKWETLISFTKSL